MADTLNKATGLNFDVKVATSYAATIEEMCASPSDTMGFIPGLGYVLANARCGVDVVQSELIGLAPAQALMDSLSYYLQLPGLSRESLVEVKVEE